MPNYNASKILAVSNARQNIVLFYLPTTNAPNRAKNDLVNKYRAYLHSNAPLRDYYPLITAAGVDNLSVSVAAAQPCASKAELNALLARVVSEAAAPPTIDELFEAALVEKRPVAAITASRYRDSIKTLMAKLDTTDAAFYKDTDAVCAWIENSAYKLESRRNVYKALCRIAPAGSAAHAVYSAAVSANATVCADIRSQNLKTDSQKAQWLSHAAIVDIHDKIPKNTRDFIVSLFYTGVYVAPYRLLELSLLKIANHEPGDNFIDGDTITLSVFKTASKYGTITQKIPAPMQRAIDAFVKTREVQSDYLICSSKGEPVSTAVLSGILKRLYGCSANIMRSSYVSWRFETGSMNTKRDYDDVSREMRNSIPVMLGYKKVDA